MSLIDAKKTMRQKAKALRQIAFEQNPLAANQLAAFAAEIEAHQKTVAGYWPIGSELDPGPLMTALAQLGASLALPRIHGNRVHFKAFEDESALISGAMGIKEPPETAPDVAPDIFLVPLLAFDPKGYRLGYGGGYYDRALGFIRAQKPCMAIGLGFAEQAVSSVPTEAHDQALDKILTPQGWARLDI